MSHCLQTGIGESIQHTKYVGVPMGFMVQQLHCNPSSANYQLDVSKQLLNILEAQFLICKEKYYVRGLW